MFALPYILSLFDLLDSATTSPRPHVSNTLTHTAHTEFLPLPVRSSGQRRGLLKSPMLSRLRRIEPIQRFVIGQSYSEPVRSAERNRIRRCPVGRGRPRMYRLH